MQIRRPLAGLFVALALSGGGATLAGCGDPTSSDTGTPKDTVSTTPSESADNSLPDNGSRETSSSDSGNG
jgi:ABC-type oligopeptide transport system substrate-binding subunit